MQNEKPKKTKSARKFATLAAGVCIACIVIILATSRHNSLAVLTIGGAELSIEIATTSQEKREGLCCRDSLPKSQGMLFVYERPGNYSFWMKDTRIPLDMVWISKDKKVVHIEPFVQPQSYPRSFSSPVPAQYILETNAGWVNENRITVGDSVAF